MSTPCCSVGSRPDADQINEALRTGGTENSVRKVAARFGLTKSAVGLHKTRCLAVKGAIEQEDHAPLPPPRTEEQPVPGQAAGHRSDGGAKSRDSVGTVDGDARARARGQAKDLQSYEDRVAYIADLLSTGRWLGRPTAKRLASLWLVERGTIQDYHRAAILVAKADRGNLDAQREASLGHWNRIRKEALAKGDLKAASTAQAGYDRAANIVETGGAKVQVTFMQTKGAKEVLGAIVRSLEPYPEARAVAVATIRAALRGRLEAIGTPPMLTVHAEPVAAE